jgi:hypothetical protein
MGKGEKEPAIYILQGRLYKLTDSNLKDADVDFYIGVEGYYMIIPELYRA